ncbi:hypothetical protein KIF24_23505 [Micromonospora sp. Llam7]|uniref:hypothetical protein n=1 Tax=Micromonospora tarapacensis TaxID=2835305 RepID=UPI001C82F7D4|nr:hypothetical protein [Micromonospora tarapacensis]MBX7268693.1 hypothetical protein [Micromonospora tarapacensis]
MVALKDGVSAPAERTIPTRSLSLLPVLKEAGPVVVLVGLFFVVNDIGSWLTAQYWGDEAWVALSTRLPLADLPVTTSSSPLGWSLLLRLVPDIDYLRIVPLGFQLLTVVTAYLLGRLLVSERGHGVLVGTVTAAAVLLVPVQQTRHDLKQYTADAAVAVTLLALACWTERSWSRGRLAVTVAAVAVGMLLSHTTAIVAPCVFGGLLLAPVVRRQWARAVEAATAGLVAGVAVAAVYLGVSASGNNDAMVDYWTAYFPAPTELPGHLAARIGALLPLLGVPGWILAVLLLVGVSTLARRGRPGTAVAVLLLPVAVSALGIARIYPLLDSRTSHFLLVVTILLAGVGAAGLADLVALAARARALRPLAVATVTCAILIGGYAVANHRWYRFDGHEPGVWRSHMAMTGIGTATRHVAAHAGPHDIVVVSATAWFGFTLYSEQDPLTLVAPVPGTVGWTVAMPTRPDVIVPCLTCRDMQSIRNALDGILARAAAGPADTRVYLIRSYTHPNEPQWREALRAYRVTQVTDGPEPVLLISST